MGPTCTPCPECGKECEGHGDAVARGACHHGVCGSLGDKRACPRHCKAGRDAGPHCLGDVMRCGCCAGTCEKCWDHTGGGGGTADGHTWPTVWVKFRTHDPSTGGSGAGSGRVQDGVGARAAEGWRQFFAKNGGEEDEESVVEEATEEQGMRSGAVQTCGSCGAAEQQRERCAGKMRCGVCWTPWAPKNRSGGAVCRSDWLPDEGGVGAAGRWG